MIRHLNDEAIRFTVASILPNKSAISIIRAITCDWVKFFGPPELIVADGESELDSA